MNFSEDQPLRAFDIGIMAEEAARAGNLQEADDLYRKAFQTPDEDNDQSWLTGSYSAFLREHGRTEEAFSLLKRATEEDSTLGYLCPLPPWPPLAPGQALPPSPCQRRRPP